MDRRHFILNAAAALPLGATGVRLLAAPRSTPRLLVVFLRGAYDAASLLVPVRSDFYCEQRPNIAIARPADTPDAALPLDSDWGLHPALRESVLPLFERRQMAFIPFAGIDDTSRSHFETQDNIELGQPTDGRRNLDSGFMNRLSQVLGSRDAIAFTDQLPLTFRGHWPVPNLALSRAGQPATDTRQEQLIAGMYRGSRLASAVDEGFAVQALAAREMQADARADMANSGRNAITAKGFEGEALRIARMMRERYRLGFVDIGGWDTHIAQGGAKGYLATRLAELGRGLAAYANEMGPDWQDSVIVVISEFGRTFKENGSRGTDHGHGTVFWVLGGAVRGGRIVGDQVDLRPGRLFQDRDYPVLNEYRAVLGGLFRRLYGLSSAQLATVFPAAPGVEHDLL